MKSDNGEGMYDITKSDETRSDSTREGDPDSKQQTKDLLSVILATAWSFNMSVLYKQAKVSQCPTELSNQGQLADVWTVNKFTGKSR